ncbi:MAG: UbiX family flavin prenyltransferase [Burkholderiales bacterium]|nr:UbiX family flavin prenyltransferase [Burkholderiales bacterium]
MTAAAKHRLVVALTGASGSLYGVRLLQAVRGIEGWETHVVVSNAAALNTQHELGMSKKEVEALADVAYDHRDIGAAIASGSYLTAGMVIVPCSMKTLAAVAHAYSDNLITRAADVALKERRRLVLVTRETPLNLAHLRNMTAVTEMGGVIYPPVPALYQARTSIDDLVNHTVGRVLDLFGIESRGLVERWGGLTPTA